MGQVHRARLRGSDIDVAVKVQYPDARSLILTDLSNIHRILKCLGKEAEAGVVREYRGRMAQEFDYETEGRTMNTVAAFFDSPTNPLYRRVTVPRYNESLSTRRLLVMDFVQGQSLRGALRSRVEALPALPLFLRVPSALSLRRSTKRKLATLLEAQGLQIFRLGTFNADPHPGPCPQPGSPPSTLPNVFHFVSRRVLQHPISSLTLECQTRLDGRERVPYSKARTRPTRTTTRVA